MKIEEIRNILKEREWKDRDYFFVLIGSSTASFLLLMMRLLEINL